MANRYLDVSAVGNEYQAYADAVTTWGVPQDGNGKSNNAATAAVAIAELDCTSASVAATNTLTICGAVLTAVASGAAANQFNVGTGSTLATNLVSSINAATNAVNVGSSSLLLGLRYFVYARVKPSFPNIVQIMMRCAGSDLNHASNSNVAITATGWATPPGYTQFIGGVDGPWAYMVNAGTIFGKTLALYGLLVAKVPTPADPGAADAIIVRTMRSSANLAVTVTNSASAHLSLTTPASSFRYFLFDNGTVWSGDNGQFQLNGTSTVSSYSVFFRAGAGAQLVLEAREKYGFRFIGQANNASAYIATQNGSAYFTAVRCLFEASATGASVSGLYIFQAAPSDEKITFFECKVLLRRNVTLNYSGIAGSGMQLKFLNTIFEWVGIGANVTNLMYFTAAPSNGEIIIEGCEFIVDGGVTYSVGSAFSGGTNIGAETPFLVRMADNKGLWNPSIGLLASPVGRVQGPKFVWTDSATGSFRMERTSLTTEYVSTSAVPTLGLTNSVGNLMSYRVSWENARLDNRNIFEIGRFSLDYKDTSAAKTCEIELLVPTAEIPTSSEMYMTLSYVDSSDLVRNETTMTGWASQFAGEATDLPAGVGIGGAGQWILNGVTGVSSAKLSLTTAYAVKQNSVITARMHVAGQPAGTYSIYVSPELRVS